MEKDEISLPTVSAAQLERLLLNHGDPAKLRELLSLLPEKEVATMVCGFRSHDEFIKKVYDTEG